MYLITAPDSQLPSQRIGLWPEPEVLIFLKFYLRYRSENIAETRGYKVSK
jgi:hypothetical protein